VLDLQPVVLRQVVDVAQVVLARVTRGDAEDLVVAAASSVMRNMPIGRAETRQPGNVGSWMSTRASSGSDAPRRGPPPGL
jgi:hypothetical protein